MSERHAAAPRPAVSIVVPFHRGLAALERVVAAAADSAPDAEIIVVATGHREDLSGVASRPGVRVVSMPAACGPAVARNRGAAAASGDVLVFVDADVVPHASAIPSMVEALAREPSLTGLFGAYDHQPQPASFYSQYRNLAHAFVHEQARPEARTFWAGLGALRADVFAAVGGFDERFPRPSIEDIDLGYRLTAAGHRLRLDTAVRGTHLRRWTFVSSLVTDVRDRGVPWTQALLKYGALANDLNVSWTGRLAVLGAWSAVAGLAALPLWPPAALIAAAGAAAFVAAHGRLLRWFAAKRGVPFALRVLAGQLAHHLCNGVSLVVGTALWVAQRAAGWRTRWTLPPDRWEGRAGGDAGGLSATR